MISLPLRPTQRNVSSKHQSLPWTAGDLGCVCMYVCMYRRDSAHTQTQSARSVLISLPEDPSCAVVVAPVLVEEGLDGVGLIGLGCIQVA